MINRYIRQIIMPEIGEQGQKKINNSFAAVMGCGALGSIISAALVRAGIGKIRIIDRDFIEYHNLQRQVLFDEDDIKNNLPKAIAAKRHLQKVNPSVEIEAVVSDINYTNIERLVQGADVIADGLDNLETRLLVNDAAMKHNIPWVYGGAIATSGMTMTIIPHKTPCYSCIVPGQSLGGRILTCDTAGILGPTAWLVASLESVEVLKILVGSPKINPDLLVIDVWKDDFSHLKIDPRDDCPACRGRYEFLEGKLGTRTTSLCGQNAVQVLPSVLGKISFEELSRRLSSLGKVENSDFMLQFTVDSQEILVFPDGRAIVKNTTDESYARGLYAKFIET